MSKALAVRSPSDSESRALDRPIERTVRTLDAALDVWEVLHPKVREFLADFDAGTIYGPHEVPADRAVKLATLLEKLSRAMSNLVKAADEAARLREFLTGGPDSRPDLTAASDGELVETLIRVVIQRGLVKSIIARAKEAGAL